MRPETKPSARAEGREVQFGTNRKPVVLVTGSTGLIGSKIVEAFAGNYQIVGLDVKPPEEGDTRRRSHRVRRDSR